MIPAAMFLSPFHFLLSPGLPATTADGYLCPESAPGAPSVRSCDRYSPSISRTSATVFKIRL